MKTTETKSLFEPIHFNGLQLNNSIVMAPMTRSRALDHTPNSLMAQYYAQRSGAGLIVTEGTAPSPDGLGYARTPGIYSAQQIAAWRDVTNAVHSKNGKIFIQLMHVGRIAHRANVHADGRSVAPSAIPAKGSIWTDTDGMQPYDHPAEMTMDEIRRTIEDFVQAAQNAMHAGFDGVELHGANGYLLEQFLNPNSNQRTDVYGGSVKNRTRFVIELAKAVASQIGSAKTGIRISPFNTFNDMPVYSEVRETYTYLSHEIAKLDLLYVHLMDFAARATPDGRELIRDIRKNFPNLLMLNGGYTKERAEKALIEDGADLISFGSTFLSNPDLPFRLENDLSLNQPDQQTFYTADAKGYIDYPVAS
jgi:N-ethylmaleimide reductase